jgi:tetratricopeptide (TPR) repeat protein
VNKPIIDAPRRVVPRWRGLVQTIAQKELFLAPSGISIPATPVDTTAAERIWAKWKTEHAAGELVSAALLSHSSPFAREAAEHLLRKNSSASPVAKQVAQRVLQNILGQTGARSDEEAAENTASVTLLRRALVVNPFDPYRWVELALRYTTLGLLRKAERALKTAYGLAREDRYVLRSLTRFELHLHRPDEALDVLTRSARLRSDPWLLASYFATATIAEKRIRFYKDAQRLNDSGSVSSFNKAELGAELATIELAAGNDKRARRLFRQALIEPTENVVAQAVWTSFKTKSQFAQTYGPAPTRNFEADALTALYASNWKLAFEQAKNWLQDEPFSERAALLASFLGSVALESFDEAQKIAEAGFTANPDNRVLLNNVAFCQASTGNIEAAKRTLARAKSIKARDDSSIIPVLATEGLIAFREGLIDEGRACYTEAIEHAEKCHADAQAAMAQMFLAKEEVRAGQLPPSSASEIAVQATKNRSEPEVKVTFECLSTFLDRCQLSSA